jgi:hypothetical protein
VARIYMAHCEDCDFNRQRGGGAMVAREIPDLKVMCSSHIFLTLVFWFFAFLGIYFLSLMTGLPGIHKIDQNSDTITFGGRLEGRFHLMHVFGSK